MTKKANIWNTLTSPSQTKTGEKVSECQTDKRGRASFILKNISPEGKYKATFTLKGVKFSEKLPEVEKKRLCPCLSHKPTPLRKPSYKP